MGREGNGDHDKESQGLSRRGFMTTVGTGAAGAAGLAVMGGLNQAKAGEAESEVIDPEKMHKLNLQINGRPHRLLAEPRWTLLFVLREKLGLTGTKMGCERGECGACTVLIDGLPRYACLTLAVEAEGHEVTTLEGLMHGEELGTTQEAFLEHDAYQCGYCTPGQIMSVEGLVRANPEPDPEEIRVGVSGNLCRCGAYKHIFEAAGKAAELKRKG